MWLVDFKKLLKSITPKWLQGSNYLLLLLAANFPLRQLHQRFINFKLGVAYRLAHNSQVCYLRKVCNDKCDAVQRRILISNFDGIPAIYLYPDADARDINYTNDVYLWPDDMYGDSGVDFTVKVPLAILNTDAETAYLKSILNQYKLAGKRYNIVKY